MVVLGGLRSGELRFGEARLLCEFVVRVWQASALLGSVGNGEVT